MQHANGPPKKPPTARISPVPAPVGIDNGCALHRMLDLEMTAEAVLDLQYHGVRCRILLQDGLLREHVVALFGHAEVPSEGTPDLTLHVVRGDSAPERPAAPQFTFISDQIIWGQPSPSGLLMSDGRTTARVDYGAARATLELLQTDYAAIYAATHRFFPIALSELLRTRGVYYLHAAAVTGPRGGVIFVGDSEAGKSTLAYTAMRDGMKLLCDDGILFSVEPSGHAYVEPYYRELAVHESTLTDEDRVSAAPTEPMHTGEDRVRFTPAASRCAGRALVQSVLRIERSPTPSHIAEQSPSELFEELVHQNPFVALTPHLAPAHVAALGCLLRSARLGVVRSGPDVLQQPGTTGRLLEHWLADGARVPSESLAAKVRPS